MAKQLCASCKNKSRQVVGFGLWVTLLGHKIAYGLCSVCISEMGKGHEQKQKLIAKVEQNLSPMLVGSKN